MNITQGTMNITQGSGTMNITQGSDRPIYPRVCSVRYRYCRYRYGCHTELTEVSGTGIDVVPNLPKCPVPVLMYRNYQSILYRYESLYRYRRYRYPRLTELTEVSGDGIDVVPKLPKCPVPVLMSFRTCRSVRYRYSCRTELTEVSGTGIHVPNLPKCPVPVLMSYRSYRSVRYRY